MAENPERTPASDLRVSAEGTTITYRLAVQPLSIYRRPPSLGIVIRAELHEGDRIVPLSVGFMRWED